MGRPKTFLRKKGNEWVEIVERSQIVSQRLEKMHLWPIRPEEVTEKV